MAKARNAPCCYKHIPGTSIIVHIHAEMEKLETSKPKHETQSLFKASKRFLRRMFKPRHRFYPASLL
jgi:shikimate kinase